MQCLRGPLAALVCLSLLTPSEFGLAQATPASLSRAAASDVHSTGRPAYHSTQIQGDERILHALNRFTFGPRPGDFESVKAVGLDRWFDQQLHPAGIDQSDMNLRLAEYPAMQWSSEDLLYRLPSNAMIRQANDGKAPVPERGVLHAVYENQMYRVAEKKQQKQEKQQANAATPNSMMPAATPAPTMEASVSSAPSAAAPDPGLITKILALPPQQRIARLAAMQPSDCDAFFKALKGPDRAALNAGLTPEMKETVGALENPQRTVVDELIAQRLTRDIYSSAQFQEVMTDFWLNHFNVFLHKNEATPYYLVSYERDVIRPRALGKFEDLLEATAHSPAMLLYLDNAGSIGPDSLAAQRAALNAARNPSNPQKPREGLNENYARELMELHTLGVNGGYTQADVIQVARILTGWTVDRPQRGGGFRFEPNRHQPGTKKVMGKKFKESGEREGRDLLHFLVTRPATVRFISRKLAVRFVSDDPPESLVDRMAKSYLSSGGDIATVLKTMYKSPEFWSASVYRAKVKTPLEYVVSAARASNADIVNLQPLANALREMGMPVYGAIPPTGYKWDAADWVSTGALVNRMNFALSLAANRLPGITATWSSPSTVSTPKPVSPQTGLRQQGDDPALSLLKDLDSDSVNSKKVNAGVPRPDASLQVSTPESEESRLESLLVAGDVSESTRSAVLQQFEAQSANVPVPQPQPRAQSAPVSTNTRPQKPAPMSAQEKQDQLLAGLLLGSPEFQRR